MTLMSPQGKMVAGELRIDDEIAVSTFAHKYIAKQLVDAEIRAGNKNVEYNEEFNAFIERFPKMDAEKIYKKLKKEMAKAGGKMLQRKDGV